MTNAELTHLAFIVDRSGSMESIRDDMDGAIKFTVAEQAKLPGLLVIDITVFDTKVDKIAASVGADYVAGLDRIIEPRGMTALNDAIGLTITNLGERFAARDEEDRPGKVIIVIVTDGLENASHEYTHARVKDLVLKQRDEFQWEILFLGADSIDAFATAGGYGVSRGQTISFAATSTGVNNVGATMNSYMTRSRNGEDTQFTDEERAASAAAE